MKHASQQPNEDTRRSKTDLFFQPSLTALIAVSMLCTSAVCVADAPLPDAGTIIDNYIKATGGKAAYERIHNRVIKGRLEFVGMDLGGTHTSYAAAPNKTFTQLDIEALGTVKIGTTGDTAWYWSDQGGVMLEEGEALAAALQRAAFDSLVHWRKYYDKVECVGEANVDGKACYKVVLTPKAGRQETRYYDKATHLLVREESVRLSSNRPETPMQLTFDDYRWVDGLYLPHTRTQVSQSCGGKRVIRFTAESIKHNVDLRPDRFVPPAEVYGQDLVNKASNLAKRIGLSHDAVQQTKSGCGAGKAKATSRDSDDDKKPGCCAEKEKTADEQVTAASDAKRGGCGGGS